LAKSGCRTVIRDRNAPSVAFWSLGNEAGYGDDFMKMRELTLADDPQHRPIPYADMNLAADMEAKPILRRNGYRKT
jgi:beta-galactosidase